MNIDGASATEEARQEASGVSSAVQLGEVRNNGSRYER